MTNLEIIANEIIARGLATEEQVERTLAKGKMLPFMTYQEWKRHGYIVKKGEKALFVTRLWKAKSRKVEDENGDEKVVFDSFVQPYCYIFGGHQVEKIGEKKEDNSQTEKAQPVKVETKAPKKESKKETKKETKKAVKTTKKSAKKKVAKTTKKAPLKNNESVMNGSVENGKNFVEITMKKADGNIAKLKMLQEDFMKLSKKDKKLWGIA